MAYPFRHSLMCAHVFLTSAIMINEGGTIVNPFQTGIQPIKSNIFLLGGTMVDKKKIGMRIKEIRMEVGLTQSAFLSRVSPTLTDAKRVSEWETGVSIPSLETLLGIALFGGVSLDWLVTGAELTPRVLPPVCIDDYVSVLKERCVICDRILDSEESKLGGENCDEWGKTWGKTDLSHR